MSTIIFYKELIRMYYKRDTQKVSDGWQYADNCGWCRHYITQDEDDTDLVRDKSKWYNVLYSHELEAMTHGYQQKGCQYPCCFSCSKPCLECGLPFCGRCFDEHNTLVQCACECHCCGKTVAMSIMKLCSHTIYMHLPKKTHQSGLLFGTTIELQPINVGCNKLACNECISYCCDGSPCCLNCLHECDKCGKKKLCDYHYNVQNCKICSMCWNRNKRHYVCIWEKQGRYDLLRKKQEKYQKYMARQLSQ